MAEDQKNDQQTKGDKPEEKELSSGDDSGQGRPRRDDHALPKGPGRNTFGTHGGPKEKKAPGSEE